MARGRRSPRCSSSGGRPAPSASPRCPTGAFRCPGSSRTHPVLPDAAWRIAARRPERVGLVGFMAAAVAKATRTSAFTLWRAQAVGERQFWRSVPKGGGSTRLSAPTATAHALRLVVILGPVVVRLVGERSANGVPASQRPVPGPRRLCCSGHVSAFRRPVVAVICGGQDGSPNKLRSSQQPAGRTTSAPFSTMEI